MKLPPKGPGDLARQLSPQLLLNRPAASSWKKEKVRRKKENKRQDKRSRKAKNTE